MNDEKRHKNLEITIYISLIIDAGIMVAMVLIAIAVDSGLISYEGLVIWTAIVFMPLVFFAGVAVAIFLLIQVVGLFVCSRLLRERLLLWYACLFTLPFAVFLLAEARVPPVPLILEDSILAVWVVVLLVLPVIWLRKLSRS